MSAVLIHENPALEDNPIEVIEQIVTSHDWPFDRPREQELTVSVTGSWCEYHLRFSWLEDHQALQLMCGLDLRVPEPKRPPIYELLGLVNEQMVIGHFDFWSTNGLIVYRQEILLRETQGATLGQCEDLIEAAMTSCDLVYPCLQFALWGGKSPKDAVAAAMLETHGTA
jgi:hypothetical protein